MSKTKTKLEKQFDDVMSKLSADDREIIYRRIDTLTKDNELVKAIETVLQYIEDNTTSEEVIIDRQIEEYDILMEDEIESITDMLEEAISRDE